jgi:hypothetical protein
MTFSIRHTNQYKALRLSINQHSFVYSAAGKRPAAFSISRMDVVRLLFALKVEGAVTHLKTCRYCDTVHGSS